MSNASTSVIKGCELRSGWKVIWRDMWHPEGGISVGIEGSQFCTNPLPPFPCSCSMWVTSPLEHPLRNSRLSLTQAHLSCGCPPSFAPIQPVVSIDTRFLGHLSLAPRPYFQPLAPNDTHLLCLQLHTLGSDITSLPQILAYPKDLQHHLWTWVGEGISCLWHHSGNV